MGKLQLYYSLFSPPARACILLAKLIGLDVELKVVDFANKEHLSDWYIKLNPQHTIPMLVDDNVPLWDSHAIMTYMVSKYAKDDSLYPKDLIKRAMVDQRLHFENGVIFQVIKSFVNHIVYGDGTEYSPFSINFAYNAYGFLEQFLSNDYVVGNHMTVADISIHTSIISVKKLIDIEENTYPRITAWLKRMESLPGNEEINEKGAEVFYQRIRNNLNENILKAGKK